MARTKCRERKLDSYQEAIGALGRLIPMSIKRQLPGKGIWKAHSYIQVLQAKNQEQDKKFMAATLKLDRIKAKKEALLVKVLERQIKIRKLRKDLQTVARMQSMAAEDAKERRAREVSVMGCDSDAGRDGEKSEQGEMNGLEEDLKDNVAGENKKKKRSKRSKCLANPSIAIKIEQADEDRKMIHD